MIVKRIWSVQTDKWIVRREGWFVLGIVPLYIRDVHRQVAKTSGDTHD